MAVTLDTQANEITPLNSAVYGISNSDTGTDPVQINAGYRVFDGTPTQIVTDQRIPNTGQEEFFDLAKVIKNLVSTPFPGPDVQNVTTFAEFNANYSISFGEIQFNKSTCDTTVNFLSTTTGKQVVNGMIEAWEDDDLFDSGDVVILSSKPSEVRIGSNQSDYLYFYRKTGDVYIALTINYTDGTTENQTTNITLNGSGGYISCGPANLFFTPLKTYTGYTIDVYDDIGLTNLIKSYRFRPLSICDDEFAVTTLYWLNSRGGWDAIALNNYSIGVARDAILYKQFQLSNASNRHQNRGLSNADRKYQEVMSVQRFFDITEGLHTFLNSISKGREFFVKYYNGTQYIAHKCELQNGTFGNITKDTVSLSLQLILNYP